MFQNSPCMLERKADPRLEHQCYLMYNVQFLSQSALSDNLVHEACQHPRYPVNFAQSRYQDRKTCALNIVYHTSNSRECMGVNGEALQLHTVYKKPYFLLQSHVRIHISATSHVRIHIRYCKSHVLHLNVQ